MKFILRLTLPQSKSWTENARYSENMIGESHSGLERQWAPFSGCYSLGIWFSHNIRRVCSAFREELIITF